jgi:hypothetical protein
LGQRGIEQSKRRSEMVRIQEHVHFTAVSSSAEARLYIPTGFIAIGLQPDETAFSVGEESFLQEIGKALCGRCNGVWMVVDFLGIMCDSILIYGTSRDYTAVARTYHSLAIALAIFGFAVAIWTMFWTFLKNDGDSVGRAFRTVGD